MINDNKNETENFSFRSHRHDITRPRARHGDKYTIYEMCLSLMMAICIKTELKKSVVYKKSV